MKHRIITLTTLVLFVVVIVVHQKVRGRTSSLKQPIKRTNHQKPLAQFAALPSEEAVSLAQAFFYDQTGNELPPPAAVHEIPRRAWEMVFPYPFALNPDFKTLVITILQNPERTISMAGSPSPLPKTSKTTF